MISSTCGSGVSVCIHIEIECVLNVRAGGMIAFKLAAIAPDRVASLALISTTGGGYECLPKVDLLSFFIELRRLKCRS